MKPSYFFSQSVRVNWRMLYFYNWLVWCCCCFTLMHRIYATLRPWKWAICNAYSTALYRAFSTLLSCCTNLYIVVSVHCKSERNWLHQMLTNFKTISLTDSVVNLQYAQHKIPPHFKCIATSVEAKYVWKISKIALLKNRMKQTAMQDSSLSKRLWQTLLISLTKRLRGHTKQSWMTNYFVLALWLFFSRPQSEGWPHHTTPFISVLLSFWLTLPLGVLFTYLCCPPRPCVIFLTAKKSKDVVAKAHDHPRSVTDGVCRLYASLISTVNAKSKSI